MPSVCPDCFGDPVLRELVRANAAEDECEFCSASGTGIAASLDHVVEHIECSLAGVYEDAQNVLFYDNEAESGYAGVTWTTGELLQDELGLHLPNDENGLLLDALTENLGEDISWCEANQADLPEHEELRFDWEAFRQHISHGSRFFLLGSPDERRILDRLGQLCVERGLIVTLPEGTRIFRARQQLNTALTSPAELGPPPDEVATQSNRMSPPGISLLYAADDEETALAETAREPGVYALGEFEVLDSIPILDLTLVPPSPSFFDLPARPIRSGLIFLNRLADEISRPIARDDRVHLEYLPTQVVTEYFRRELRPVVKGIRYPSAQHEHGTCIAIFAGAKAIVDGVEGHPIFPERRWIRMVRAWTRPVGP